MMPTLPLQFSSANAPQPVVAPTTIPTQLANLCSASIARRPGRRRSSASSNSGLQNVVELGSDYELGLKDVVCGSKILPGGGRRFSVGAKNGASSSRHSGNLRLRVMVELQLSRYQQDCNIIQQSKLVKSVVDSVQESGGNFVMYMDGSWWQVSRSEAIKYTTSLFRNGLSSAQEFCNDSSSSACGFFPAEPQQPAFLMMKRHSASSAAYRRVGHVLLVQRRNRPNYDNVFSQMASIARA